MNNNIRVQFEQLMDRAKLEMGAVNWRDRHVYAGWLAQTYYFVRHSSRLLALGAASAALHEDVLHRRMVDHLREEMGHDKVAALDIKNLGFTLEDFPELTTTRAFYQNQYYTLQNEPAASFLGWILFLEGVASTMGPTIFKNAEAAFGLSGSKFIKLHAEEDQEHIQSALKVADGLSHVDAHYVIANMKQSADLYLRMLQEVQESATRHGHQRDERRSRVIDELNV